MMDFRNASYNEFGGIDCEIDHPDFGWIPHTIDGEAMPDLLAEAALVATPYVPPVPPEPTIDDVNLERDSRLVRGVPFNVDGIDYIFDSDERSQGRIDSMATLARFAITAGAMVDDYSWRGGESDFRWITQDNSEPVLDAFEMRDLGDAFTNWIEAHVFSAKVIKDIPEGIPSDYADDSRWP